MKWPIISSREAEGGGGRGGYLATEGRKCSSSQSLSDPCLEANFRPVRLSGISPVLLYDELNTSHGERNFAKMEVEEKKRKHPLPQLPSPFLLLQLFFRCCCV